MFGTHLSRLGSVHRLGLVPSYGADFTNGSPTPAVRTTRSGLATCIGPDGTLQWGPHNNLPESQNFGAWAKLGTVPIVTPSAGVDADGTPTDRIYFPASGSGNRIQQTTFSIGLGSIRIRLKGEVGGEQIYVWNGWSSINQLVVLTTQYQDFTFSESAVNPSSGIYLYAASGTPTIYATRAQHNHGPIQEYLNSTVKNRLGYSNDFANAAWTKTNSTPYPATTTQSDGTPATLLCDNATAGLHFARQDVAVTAGSWAVQIRAKQASLGFLWISMDGGSNTTWFNLATGAVGTNNTGTPTMVLGSDGFYTCQLVRTLGAVTAAIFYGVSAADAVASYAGTGQGVYIANACLVPGTGAANYFYNAGPAPAVGAYYAQRTDYDVSTVSGIGPDLLGGTGVLTSVANGTGVASLPGWASYGTPTVAAVQNGALTLTANTTNQGGALFLSGLVIGKAYQMKLDVGGTYVNVYSGSWVISSFDALVGNGKGYVFVASATSGYVYFRPNGNSGSGTSTINNIVVQEAFAGAIAGYGSENVVNGGFDVDANWVKQTGFGISGGTLNYNGTGTLYSKSYQDYPLSVGKTYVITGQVKALSTGDLNIIATLASLGGNLRQWTISTTGAFCLVWVATNSSVGIAVQNNLSNQTFSIDDLSVKEVIFANRGALIEPTQVTQLLANPDDLSASPWTGAVAATNDGTKYRGRPMWKLTKTTTSAAESRGRDVLTSTGYFTNGFAAMASATSTQLEFGLLGGTSAWGVNGNAVCSIASGPGTLTQSTGGLWKLVGLATNVPTVIAITRNFLVTEAINLSFYPDTTASTTIGKAIYVQVDNLVAGTDGGGSFIPNPATSGTVVRVADDARVNYDDLAKALPWLMDTNIIPAANVESFDTWTKTAAGTASLPVVTANDTTYAAPDGTFTADKVVFNVGAGTTAANESSIDSSSIVTVTGAAYTGSFRVMGSAGTQLMLRHVGGNTYGLITCSGLGIWDEVPGRTEIAGTTSSTMSIGIRQGIVGTINSTATVWLWGAKLNPGPVAQTYYPQSSKQGTIVFEGDLTYGAGSAGVVLASLDTGAATGVEFYKATANNNFIGYVGAANYAISGTISSGSPIKSAIGFSPSSAGIALNGGSEVSITASVLPSGIKQLLIGKGYSGNAASSMHIRRLRIFSQNLPASTKQALTR